MSGRRRLAVLLGCVVVALLAAWYAGSRFPAPAPLPAAGSVRLGPDAGEPVESYQARLAAELPPPGTATLALVQLSPQLRPADALAATAASPVLTVVFRAPIPRVQTALRFEQVEPGVPVDAAVATARDHARRAATADAARLTGRPRDVAAAEASALADPDCPCVLAVLVRADRPELDALATAPAVRAVHAAPAGVTARELALSPLLPEQSSRADPVPDDGPVPPA